jgi:hypothetical protein
MTDPEEKSSPDPALPPEFARERVTLEAFRKGFERSFERVTRAVQDGDLAALTGALTTLSSYGLMASQAAGKARAVMSRAALILMQHGEAEAAMKTIEAAEAMVAMYGVPDVTPGGLDDLSGRPTPPT